MAKQLKITLVKSTIGTLKKQKATIEALGLTKIGTSKIHNDNPCLQGQINVVKHLISVEEVVVAAPKKAKAKKAEAVEAAN